MSSTYTTAEGSLSFLASADSFKEPHQANVAVLDFPGGDNFAISISGLKETRRTFKVMLDSMEDFRILTGIMRLEGALYVEGWDVDPQNAVLVDVDPDPPWNSGEITATVQFILY